MVPMMRVFIMFSALVLSLGFFTEPAEAVEKNLLTIEQAEKSLTNKLRGRRSRGRAGLSAYTRRFRNPGNEDRTNTREERPNTGSVDYIRNSNKGRNQFGYRRFDATGKEQDIVDWYRRPRYSRR